MLYWSLGDWMKRVQTPCVVVTFYTTAAAMETERACRAAGIPGRIFPVPRQLTSDCGMAWRSEISERDRLDALLRGGIEFEGIYEMEL